MLPEIRPIKLLVGSHADTGVTGQGCFMNVIAYLNGEPQVTDASPCVCPSIRPIAIWANDFMRDHERVRLLPFIERAMGCATDDPAVMERRRIAVVAFAERCAAEAARAAHAAARAAEAAEAARAARAAHAAADAAHAAADAARPKLVESVLQLLDEICPPAQPLLPVHVERAKQLAELCNR